MNDNDHKKLGKELDLFTFSDTVGKGLPLWTHKGAVIRREIERWVTDEEIKDGYQHVYTPDIAKIELYEKSGHYPYYKESMYSPIEIDDEKFMLRPMTCPHHFELYLSKPHSYKELPIRIAEIAKLYRYEQSGELMGLQRVRSFCLADAHIICNKSQAGQEIDRVLDLIERLTDTLGLKPGTNYKYRLSLGDRKDEKKYFKDDASWEFAENVLRQSLLKRNANFYEAEKEAAFYGPKIDFQMTNVNGKEDTAFTVQYDFVMPQRFDLTYKNESNHNEQAIVIHRSSIGAIERIIAFLIEHFTGSFPFWISPVQAIVLPISDKHEEYASKVISKLRSANIRSEVDSRSESLSSKIRDAVLQKIPYILVVGDKEMALENISLKTRAQEGQKTLSLDQFIQNCQTLIKEKSLKLV